MLEKRAEQGDMRFTVEFESAETIDTKGIVFAVSRALSRGVNILAPDSALVRIQLDGSLHAPPEYAQETIIDGDELVPLISLASIAAKVLRDRLILNFPNNIRSTVSKNIRATARNCITKC